MCGEARSAMKLLADHLPTLSYFGSLFVTDFQESSACICENGRKTDTTQISNGRTRIAFGGRSMGMNFRGQLRPYR